MSISIISASTGNGHNAVMNTLAEAFKKEYAVKCYPSFYEDLLPSNRILSNFYNLLQKASIALCKKYTELAIFEGKETQNRLYESCYDALDAFVRKEEHDAIISTTPLLNRLMIRYLKENSFSEKIPFYIVVTDPYYPIYPGFEEMGATRYFCANDVVKSILSDAGVEADKINVFGYPIAEKFCRMPSENEKMNIYKKYGLKAGKPVLLMNSGAQGSFHYLSIIKAVAPKYRLIFQLIVICGKNKGLFRATQLYCHKNGIENIAVLPYINNMEELLYISDACITKAGANMVYECLLACTPLIIDSTDGLLYQEQGIVQFLKKYSIGYVFEDTEALNNILHALDSDGLTEQLKRNIDAMHLVNGTEKIVNSILNDISVSNTANEVKG